MSSLSELRPRLVRLLSPSTVPDTMVRHLQSADVYRRFTEFRQETSMLRSLQHPCIVSLVGINIHPLCFALQLAPLGSLNTVLAEERKGKGTSRHARRGSARLWRQSQRCVTVAGCSYMPLGHMLTFKVAYQIAAGLAYLHRKSIIFCDLKSDNILVWSLEVRMRGKREDEHTVTKSADCRRRCVS